MAEPTSHNLTGEDKQGRGDGRGDGWTLDEHLAEHRRLPTAVKFVDHQPGLSIRHRTPGRWKAWVGLALLVGGIVGLAAMGGWPMIREQPIWLYGGGLVVLTVALWILGHATAASRIVLNIAGLRSTAWPPGSGGERFTVALADIRRFKVARSKVHNAPAYQLHLHTRRGEQHTLIPRIVHKRDAYLMAMLLIEHVKRLRAEEKVF